MAGKNQLHQLLTVEQDRRARATEIVQEVVALFSKKEEHLDGVVKSRPARGAWIETIARTPGLDWPEAKDDGSPTFRGRV